MKRKMMLALLLTCALMPVMAQAFGNKDTWSSGWGQGVSEFVIKGPGQSQLSLTCDDSGTAPATIQFTDATGHNVGMDNEKTLQVRIDGGEAIDISESDSRVGENNLTLAWNALRTGKQALVTGDGVRPALFTLNGAGKVLPAFGTHGCVSRASL
ncbi:MULTISPECIES: hypothetical protein [Klebsiella/Raoultella group]|uniref:hypothetical protein n=1 Tax=Enterobacteriaceae TaxID=543 RepID=UPI00191F3BC4|nr:hypothetical protein [Klebsiella michiganensis]ELK7551352.1 hypothetical protein [Citrobacter freundii]MBL0772691.1 hypothetical protein [Klebsiella michiganensis]HBL6731508.1 hypothetical protein [Serratia liquefaciens]HDG1722926.1 hypothetical protein [Kluyvera ascorbata]